MLILECFNGMFTAVRWGGCKKFATTADLAKVCTLGVFLVEVFR